MSVLFIKNIDTLVTCDDGDQVLRHVDMRIENGVIKAIAPTGILAHPEGCETISAEGMWLYPGLVNTHHHLYQYFTRNLPQVQKMELFDWLITLYEIWKNLNEDTVRLSSLCGMGELLKYGCTTCADHHYVFPEGAGSRLIDAQIQAAKELGIRLHATRGSMSLSKKDGGLPPDTVVQKTDTILKDSQRLIETYHDPNPYSMVQLALAPCSPFSVTADLLLESARLARSYGVRLHTHLCETKDEEAFTLARTGMRPYDYMESLEWVGNDVWYAHGIFLNDDELARMAKTGTGVAHCPCSNMKLSSGVCRVPDMLKLDVPLGLAVDGSASNDGSSMLEELRTAYLLHRLTYGEKAPTGYELLKVATRGSARLLGRSDIGQLAVDKAADLFMIDSRKLEFAGTLYDPMSFLGTVGYHAPAAYTIVNGKVVAKDGRLVNVDEGRIREQSDREVARLLS